MATHTRLVLFLFTAGCAAIFPADIFAAGRAAPQNRVVVAVVFSKPIYADELEPNPAMKLPSDLTDEQRSQWQASQRNERLSQLIWAPLIDQYCLSRPCEPTDEEIAAFNQHLERMEQQSRTAWKTQQAALTEELHSLNVTEIRRKEASEQLKQLELALATEEHMYDGMTPEQRRVFEASRPVHEREVARTIIRAWKFNKALYQEYGGRVIFQQAGMEPLDAYRAWLKKHEDDGDFAIHDAALREQFWSYFLSEGHNVVPIESFRKDTGMADPWEKPWWQLSPKEKTN